jgi:hypothetical protein
MQSVKPQLQRGTTPVAIKARSSGHPFASKTNDNEELLQSSAPGPPFFPLQMIYGLSGNWRIECSIDIDQNLGLAITADPILLTAMAVMGQPELDVFAALADVIDEARFRRRQDQHPRGIGHAPLKRQVLPFIERRRVDPLKFG